MDYYLILKENSLYTQTLGNTNQLPFTLAEAQKAIYERGWDEAKCINISEDIRNQGISIEDNMLLEEKQWLTCAWRNAFFNNNLHGFSMPKKVHSNKAYIDVLKELLDSYKKEMQKVAFKYENGLEQDVKQNCELILQALSGYLMGNQEEAEQIILSIIKNYIEDPFWVSDLDKSYAFRGVAPFFDLHSAGYEEIYREMMDGSIDFYRARTEKITNRKDVLHIPFDLINLVCEQRFSLKYQPCLYLGTTSYDCWQECREPALENFYLSGFRASKEGKKLKILNLVVSEALINGVWQKYEQNIVLQKLQNSMIKLLPLVLATSFIVTDDTRTGEKYEYIIPHLLMQALSKLNIDGVAYLSKRGKDDFQYPQGVNLAIPVLDINSEKQYSDICNYFIITEPQCFKDICNRNIKTESISYLHRAFDQYYSTKKYIDNFGDFQLVDDRVAGKTYERYS